MVLCYYCINYFKVYHILQISCIVINILSQLQQSLKVRSSTSIKHSMPQHFHIPVANFCFPLQVGSLKWHILKDSLGDSNKCSDSTLFNIFLSPRFPSSRVQLLHQEYNIHWIGSALFSTLYNTHWIGILIVYYSLPFPFVTVHD